MKVKLSAEKERIFRNILTEVCKNSRILESVNYIQHGNTSVFRHSVSVAYTSFWLASKLRIRINQTALIRGALLHDYFLYDWHEPDDAHKWHGFYHAKLALANAMEDFELSEVEQDLIKHHMFPLNLAPPMHKEAWIVCLADKICSSGETVDGIIKRLQQSDAVNEEKKRAVRH